MKLIITILSNFPRIRLLDERTHRSADLCPIQAVLGALDIWSRDNIDNQSVPRSVWQVLTQLRHANALKSRPSITSQAVK